MESDTTSHLRPSILTSFLSRGSRPRSTAASPTGESPIPPNGTQPMQIGNVNARRRVQGGANPSSAITPTGSAPLPASSMPIMPAPTATSFTQMLRRRRSGNGALNQAAANNTTAAPAVTPAAHPSTTPANPSNANNSSVPTGPAHRIRLVPHLENSRALHFDPITRECREGAAAIRIGRFTDRSGTLAASTNSLTGKIAFKSKVVSRGHAELWCESGGKFYVKDTSSSSGTFLNHIRLSSAGVESRPHMLKDGDILQLGVDYQGGTEEIYRCVKIRVEIGREWQAGPNPFNTNAMAQLKALSNLPSAGSAPAAAGTSAPKPRAKKTTVSDCCICLFPVTVCQALFIAPCSHSFHYKCIRGTLFDHHPAFSCPLCRSFHNLEADVEIDIQEEDDEWEELPEETNEGAAVQANTTQAIGNIVGDDDENDVSAMMQDDMAAMDISENNPTGRRSVDDDDDIHPGFQTAAEYNDRRLLPQSHNQSQSHLGQTLTSQTLAQQASNTLPNLPPPPTASQRRPPRRGTMVQGSPNQGPTQPSEDVDQGFETDTGVVGFGGETDMDVDEPRYHSHGLGGHARTGSGRGRNPFAAGNQTPNAAHANGAYSGSAMSSAPNLLRPGSAMGHPMSPNHNHSTPPTGTNMAPYHVMPGRANSGSSHHLPHMGHSSSNPGSTRMPGSSSSHLLGDGGVTGDPEDVGSGEEHTMESGFVTSGAVAAFSGSKRKR